MITTITSVFGILQIVLVFGGIIFLLYYLPFLAKDSKKLLIQRKK